MIRYSLKCDKGHGFDSWFANAGAYETLKASGHLACAVCGSATVDKALMAPAVASATPAGGEAPRADAPLSPQTEIERRLAELREKVERHSHYVGGNFVKEARAIHDGDAPERPIWGEARPDEARALLEDGVPVLPLPFVPKSHTN